MALENVMKLCEELQKNEELRAKINSAETVEAIAAIALEAGFDVSLEDLKAGEQELRNNIAKATDEQISRLSMSELESVVGGNLGNGDEAPDGHEMGCFLTYHGLQWQIDNNIDCKNSYYRSCNGNFWCKENSRLPWTQD